MIIPEIEALMSPDLDYGSLPRDPQDSEVRLDVEIGPKGSAGADADLFSLRAVTPAALAKSGPRRWGRGCLVLERFSWAAVEQALSELMRDCAGADWDEVARNLDRFLVWEFDSQPDAG